jgi:DNA repair exonuclease SbcCD ATPase subunit
MTGQASGGSGSSPFGEIIRLVMGAQERSLTVAQAWSESLQQLVRDQAEGNRATLEALASALTGMERALESQEETNRALRQSLESYRELIERAGAAQERSARLLQTALDSFAATAQGQLEAARALLTPLGSQAEPFGKMFQEWNAAFLRLLEAAPGTAANRPEQGST